MSAYLFVYGTLRQGYANAMAAMLAKHAEFVCPAHYKGQMYLVGHYPGVVASAHAEDKVYGELYRLLSPAFLWPHLDAYEACAEGDMAPTEYRRVQVSVTSAQGQCFDGVWIYLYQWSLANKPRIVGGEFTL